MLAASVLASSDMADDDKPHAHSMVVRGWGKDKPGIAESFMKVVTNRKCILLDLAQYLLEDFLMFTFVLQVGDENSMLLVKDLMSCAKEKNLQVDFHFPDQSEKPETMQELETAGENLVAAYFVSKNPKALSAAFLHDMDAVLQLNNCVIADIEHRGDNRIENNGENSKLSIIIRCPRGMKLGMLYLGEPAEDRLGLQSVAWAHDLQCTVQWWDAMNRPNGKSLVVFGMSHVLCPYDVLDEVLKEAGLNPAAAEKGESAFEHTKNKVSMLRGHSSEAISKVMQRLELTPGAQLVTSTLKRLGFKLAILTNTGVRDIGDHLSKRLDLDYVISQDLEVEDGLFTGEFQGMADVRFRKSDLLKLMADREGIEYRNVITVGEIMTGLKGPSARQVVDMYGPGVWFNSDTLKDLTISLYLLGLNWSDVHSLRSKTNGYANGDSKVVAPRKRLMTQVSAKNSEQGQMVKIFGPLKENHPHLVVETVRQCSLQDGGMVLGIEISLDQQGSDHVAKEMLLACQKHGIQVMDMNESSTSPDNSWSWKSEYTNRYVITMVRKPSITSESLGALLRVLSQIGVNVVKLDRLSRSEFSALQLAVIVPEGVSVSTMSETLVNVSQEHKVDIAFQCDDVDRWMRRLVVFDMDSTLIQQEVIDELAKLAGVETEVKTITEAAMRGELDFFGSLKARVALLKGHNAEQLFQKVKENLIFTPGAKRLCSTLKKLGFKMAVISGGFLPVAQEVQRHLGLDYAFANTLEVEEQTGMLTGCTSGPVVTPQRKRALLATIANVEGCDVSQTIAVGDGANDIPMLNAAGLGIAFCAKPKVQAATEIRINQHDLGTVLFLIGVNDYAADRLAGLEDGPILMRRASRFLAH